MISAAFAALHIPRCGGRGVATEQWWLDARG